MLLLTIAHSFAYFVACIAFVGPKISASFFDATGSYVMGFIGSAILAAVAVLLVIVAKNLLIKC